MTTTASVPLTRRAGRTSTWALARAEGRRIVAHPAFIVALLLTAWFLAVDGAGDSQWPTQRHTLVTGFGFSFLLIGTAVASGWVLTREHGEREWFPGAPLTGVDRAKARLLALLWPVAVSAGLVLALWAAITIEGGVATGDALAPSQLPEGVRSLGEEQVVPDLLTLACVPAAVAMVGACAYALASWARLAGTVVAAFATFATTLVYWAFAPIFWITPLVIPGFEVDQVVGFDPSTASPGTILLRPDEYAERWRIYELVPAVSAAHVVFLVGLTGLWGALALHRARRHDLPDPGTARGIRTLAVCSAVVAAAGIAGQLLLAPAGWSA